MLVLQNKNFNEVLTAERAKNRLAFLLRNCASKNQYHVVITAEDIGGTLNYNLLRKWEKLKCIKFNRKGYSKKIDNVRYSQVEIFINPEFMNWHQL